MGQNNLCFLFALPGCVALPQNELWKNGAGEAAADRSQGTHSASSVLPILYFALSSY